MMNLREKIDPKHTALVVIDVQNDFASADSRYFRAARGGDLSQVDPMVDAILQVVPVAEKAGVLVSYFQQIYDRSKLTDLQKEQYDLDGKLITCDIASDGWKFYRIDPTPEKVFQKYNYNIFSNKDFVHMLEKRNIKTLVITGMDTIYCVETAIRNGFDLGYKIVVPEDMIAGNANKKDLNDRTLQLVQKVYGVVSSFQELLDIWRDYS